VIFKERQNMKIQEGVSKIERHYLLSRMQKSEGSLFMGNQGL